MAGHAGDDPRALEVDDVVKPPENHPRFPQVDGLRAIAALSIVVYHAGLFGATGIHTVDRILAAMSIGVPVFFLISGFLLYRPFIAHRNGGGGAPHTPEYFKRRALRIFPAYWLILLVLTVVPGISAFNGPTTIWDVTLTHQLPLPGNTNCVVTADACGLAQTWSLVVEVSFYVFLPVYALLVAALTRGFAVSRWARVELALLAILGLSTTVITQASLQSFDLSFISGTLIGHFLWFALGMGLAVASVRLAGNERVAAVGDRALLWWLLALAVFLVIVFAITPRIGDGQAYLILGAIAQGLFALLLLLPATFPGSRPNLIARFLDQPLVAWLGLISYGIFLWHFVIALELGNFGAGLSFIPLLAAILAITIPIAAASYYLLERPILRFKR